MANTSSARKANRASERRRLHNKPIRTSLKTFIKKAEATIAAGATDANDPALIKAFSVLDKAAGKNIIHRNNAARHKSRLMKKFNQAQAAATA